MNLNFSAALILAALALSACAKKTTTSVFPESQGLTTLCGTTAVAKEFIVEWEDGRRTLERGQTTDEFKTQFIAPKLSRIRHVEYNKRFKLHPQAVSSPTAATSDLVSWGQTMIEAASAWNQNVSGEGVRVGVVDTAVDINHEQLKSRIAKNSAEVSGKSSFDDDGNGLVDDVAGWDFFDKRPQGVKTPTAEHGTHVAGIIAADPSAGPIQGVAPKAELVIGSFIDDSGNGDLYGALEALDYVAAQGAKVINASWGGPDCSESLKDSLVNLSKKDIVLVVAAGNSGVDLEAYPDYPALFQTPTQLTVAAIRSSGFMASFSNTSYKYVHLAAPGDTIYSTVPGNQYVEMSGTSMAAPFVTGAAALLRSYRPTATALQVRQALLESVDTGDYRVLTQGRLNVRKALARLKELVP